MPNCDRCGAHRHSLTLRGSQALCSKCDAPYRPDPPTCCQRCGKAKLKGERLRDLNGRPSCFRCRGRTRGN